ncbi:MAG: hypothetical protein M0C28_20875 [Candidatus Moduliflexus flocculans]|nr:hypothetical protein [Candidatus Moduliflexus flocculans]
MAEEQHARHLQGRVGEPLQQRPRPGPGRGRLGGRGPQGRLLEQGGRAHLRPGGGLRPGEGLLRGAGPVRRPGRRRHLPRQVPRGHDPQGRRAPDARRLSPAQGRVPHAGVLRIIPVFKDGGEIIGAVETFTGTAPKVTIPLNPGRAREDGPRRRRDAASPPSSTWT